MDDLMKLSRKDLIQHWIDTMLAEVAKGKGMHETVHLMLDYHQREAYDRGYDRGYNCGREDGFKNAYGEA